MFHVIFGLPWLYVMARFLWPLAWKLPVKAAVAFALLLASQYHLFSLLSSGSVFSPEFPRSVVIGFNWAFSVILLTALLQLLADVAALLTMLARRKRIAIAPGVRYAIGVAALVLAGVGVQQAIRVPPVKDVQIAIKNLPPQFDGYKVLQLTDLHISRLFDEAWTAAVVNDANRLGVDLVVVTGDLIDGAIDDRAAAVAPLSGLRAPDGVYVIPGNHEYFFSYEAWMQHFAALGMRPLGNRHAVLERGGARLVLAGVTDVTAPQTGFPAPNLAQALIGAPPDAPVILLDHQPKNARLSAERGVGLQLSGHTHGGLIYGLGWLFERANGGFVSGLYHVGAMQLYVNNGTALWPGLALRLGRPSELTRITLRRQPD